MNLTSKYTIADDSIQDSNHFFRDTILYYLKRSYWFVICVIVSLFLAKLRLEYQIPLYQSTAKVLFKNTENGGLFNESSTFQDLGYGYNYSPIENEIEILKSRSLMKEVVKDLKLNVVIFNNDKVLPVEEYENCPLKITFLSGDSSIYNKAARFDLTILSNNKFVIKNENDRYKYEGFFGEPFHTKIGEIILTPSGKNNSFKIGQKKIIYVYELEDAVDLYAGNIQIDRSNEYSNVLEISLVDNSIEKSKDIVNKLILLHQIEAIEDKNQVAKNSSNFINDRIAIISKELSEVEGDVQSFKTLNNITDVNSEVGLFIETQQQIEKDIVENEIQLKLSEYVNDYIRDSKKISELLPTNLGLSDLSIINSIETYNTLVLERNRILKNSNEKNPVALNLETKILDLQSNLRESFKKYENTLKVRGKQLKIQNDKLGNRISSVPRQEKLLREIQRQQQIKESLYLYLLQKREETAITLALTVSNSRVIDEAYSNGNVVSPSKKNFYLIALVFGLLIPFVGLLILKKFDTKIQKIGSLEKLGLNILAEIPKTSIKEARSIFNTYENSPLSESFRLLRTNLNFLINSDNSADGTKTILITSTLPKEGKSFISLNMAKSLALLDKKVLVIGMDLRLPKLAKYLQLPDLAGITNFVVNSDLSFEDILVKNPQNHKFDFISSGDIPPNPSELLLSHKIDIVFEEAKKRYDYIIVDSAPMSFVSDTLLLNKYANLVLYVVRNKYLDKKYLSFIKKMKDEAKLENLHFIFNFSNKTRDFGNQYKDYYGIKNENKLKKIIKKLLIRLRIIK